MKKTKIWLFLMLASMSFNTLATETSTKGYKNTNKQVSASVSCKNWWFNCILDKIVSGESYTLLGPGVSGDPKNP